MLDFIKIQTFDYNEIQKVKSSSFLSFNAKVDDETGEVKSYSAVYHNFHFYHLRPIDENENNTHRLTIRGSLHKYWNGGKHNYNDFNKETMIKAYHDFITRFKITPFKYELRQLEVGCNITPSQPAKKIVQCCLMARYNKPYISTDSVTNGYYVQTEHKRHFNKIYDKGSQYRRNGYIIPFEILRIERKFKGGVEIKKQLGLETLADIPYLDFNRCKAILLDLWNMTLFYDWTTLDVIKYSSQVWWLSHSNRNNFRYHKNQLNKKLSDKSDNLKGEIKNLIDQKIDELKTTRLGASIIVP